MKCKRCGGERLPRSYALVVDYGCTVVTLAREIDLAFTPAATVLECGICGPCASETVKASREAKA